MGAKQDKTEKLNLSEFARALNVQRPSEFLFLGDSDVLDFRQEAILHFFLIKKRHNHLLPTNKKPSRNYVHEAFT